MIQTLSSGSAISKPCAGYSNECRLSSLDARSAREPFKKCVGVMSETSGLKIKSFNLHVRANYYYESRFDSNQFAPVDISSGK